MHPARSTIAIVFALAAVAGAARAEEPAAKAAFLEGERSFQLGKFEDAIAAYERAYRLDPQPAFVFNIALAHRRQYELDGKLDHLLRARELYRNYLRLDPDSPRRAGVEKILGELGAKIDAARARPEAATTTPPPAGERVALQPAPPPLVTPPPAQLTAPAPEARPQSSGSSRTIYYLLGGLALVAAVAIGVVLFAARDRGTSFDGPPVDVTPR